MILGYWDRALCQATSSAGSLLLPLPFPPPPLMLSLSNKLKKNYLLHRAAWVVQSVELLTLDFGSGHYLGVIGLSPVWAPRAQRGVGFFLSLLICHHPPSPMPSLK